MSQNPCLSIAFLIRHSSITWFSLRMPSNYTANLPNHLVPSFRQVSSSQEVLHNKDILLGAGVKSPYIPDKGIYLTVVPAEFYQRNTEKSPQLKLVHSLGVCSLEPQYPHGHKLLGLCRVLHNRHKHGSPL